MDLQEAFDAGFDAVKAYVDKSFSAFERRLLKMESQLAAFPVPKDGKDADVDEVAALAAAALLPELKEVRSMVEAIPALPDVPAMIAQAFAAMPVPVDGKDADPEVIKRMVEDAVAALPPAEKGKDADPEMVASLVKEEAERILAGWERPQDGKDGQPGEKGADGAPGRDGIDGQAGKDGADGRDGKDGINGKDGIDAMDVVIDREGQLVFTMSDGRMRNVGLVVGKDGEPGRDGLNGAAGKDGADGVGFDDLDLVETENGVFLRFTRGDVVKDFRLPIVTDRGVFKEGSTYLKGDGVTWGGSFWIAQDETTEKPDSGKGWRLAVKKGRDGKDGGTK